MPTFYRGPMGRITDKVIEVPRLCRRRFPISELEWVQAVQIGPEPGVLRARLLGLSTLASVFVTVPVIGRVSGFVAALVVVVSVAYAASCLRVRPVMRYQMHARCQGQVVVLFETEDRGEFDQICRALRRAAEFGDDVA
jgi:hypothetical protein